MVFWSFLLVFKLVFKFWMLGCLSLARCDLFQNFKFCCFCCFSLFLSSAFIVFMIQGLNLHIEGENVTKLASQAYNCFIAFCFAFIFRLLLHMRSLVHSLTRSLAYPIVSSSFFYCLCIQWRHHSSPLSSLCFSFCLSLVFFLA